MFLLAHRLEGLGYSQQVPSRAWAKTAYGGENHILLDGTQREKMDPGSSVLTASMGRAIQAE